jgi:hypothetical protein
MADMAALGTNQWNILANLATLRPVVVALQQRQAATLPLTVK